MLDPMVARALIAAVVLACWSPAPAPAHQDPYPMAAAEYRKKSEQRMKRYRERLEQRMAEHKVAAQKRAAARKRLAAAIVELRALVAQHGKDGTITLAEANDVRDRGKQLRDALYRDLGFARDKGE